MLKKIIHIVSLLLIFNSFSLAQTFGFGCLGLAGIYAGISEYRYDVPALNDFLKAEQFSNDLNQLQFTRGTGYRIGANLFRAKWEGFFLSAKGYYQFIKEQKISNSLSLKNQKNFQLNMNNWGLGLDLGTPIFKILDWKILEGNISYYTPELVVEYYENSNFIKDRKFTPENTKLSYFVGSGIIFHLVPDYISVEGTAGYNFLQIDHFKSEDNILIGSSSNKAVKNAGWSYTLQINVGFPL